MAPMRILDQQIMNQVFAVTDEVPVDREALQVALVLEGEGKVERTAAGKFAVTLPDTDDLGPFLAALGDRLRALLPPGQARGLPPG
jgi:hypothetical protein